LNAMLVEKRLWSLDTRGVDLVTSDIGLAPLPDNRFTRGKCSFKVLEYSSAGLPVVASPVGTNSEYVNDGTTGFLVTDTRQWIDRITELIENPDLRKIMGREGRGYAQNFDISAIGERLAELIRECLQDD
jgi:glycosyltransferase involved in cell wall biosynthesis